MCFFLSPCLTGALVVEVLCFLLELCGTAEGGKERPTIVQFSSDDCYNTKASTTDCTTLSLLTPAVCQAAREAAQLASRLHEDNVDTSCAEILWELKQNQDSAKEIRLPRFNKGKDDREPEEMWDSVLGVADIVMYEGWRVGIDHPLYARQC